MHKNRMTAEAVPEGVAASGLSARQAAGQPKADGPNALPGERQRGRCGMALWWLRGFTPRAARAAGAPCPG